MEVVKQRSAQLDFIAPLFQLEFAGLFSARSPDRVSRSDRQRSPERLPVLRVGDRDLPVRYVRHRRARRYIVSLNTDGSVRVTLPRRGSLRGAQAFARQSTGWIAKQLAKPDVRSCLQRDWQPGHRFLFRGETVTLALDADTNPRPPGHWRVTFADQSVPVPAGSENLRPPVERHLWDLARRELPPRLHRLATTHGLAVKRVTVRNQRTLWGSCSRRGTVSLNWRLVQTPSFVCEYIMLHELMHLRVMSHSKRFWRQVEKVCPGYRDAEAWMNHNQLLG